MEDSTRQQEMGTKEDLPNQQNCQKTSSSTYHAMCNSLPYRWRPGCFWCVVALGRRNNSILLLLEAV